MTGGNSKSEIRNPKSDTSVDSRYQISDSGIRIFLIGYRCTGKTTVARLLGEKLGWDSVDADEVLEARYKTTIRQIFASEGEAGFRDKEEQVFVDLCQLRQHVIATGGGVILRESNRHQMREAGFVIWLTADAETIWKRMQSDPASSERRPPLTVGGMAEIEDILRIREPLYRACAQLTLSSVERSPEEIAQQIAQLLSRSHGGMARCVCEIQKDELSQDQ
jgi:shikimate kinase